MMKIPLPLFLGAITLSALIGCSSLSPSQIKNDPVAIAQRIGDETNKLLFVSEAHVTPAEVVSDHYRFSSKTHGLIALTDQSLLWSIRSDNYAPNYILDEIQLAAIDGVSYHQGYLQLLVGQEVHVIRPTLSNPFENTSDHTAELFHMLLSRNVPELELENPFRPNSKRPLGPLDANPGPFDNPSEYNYEMTFPEKGHVSDGNGGHHMGTVIHR